MNDREWEVCDGISIDGGFGSQCLRACGLSRHLKPCCLLLELHRYQSHLSIKVMTSDIDIVLLPSSACSVCQLQRHGNHAIISCFPETKPKYQSPQNEYFPDHNSNRIRQNIRHGRMTPQNIPIFVHSFAQKPNVVMISYFFDDPDQ